MLKAAYLRRVEPATGGAHGGLKVIPRGGVPGLYPATTGGKFWMRLPSSVAAGLLESVCLALLSRHTRTGIARKPNVDRPAEPPDKQPTGPPILSVPQASQDDPLSRHRHPYRDDSERDEQAREQGPRTGFPD